MIKKENNMICFEVLDETNFDDEILFLLVLEQLDLKIYFLECDEIIEEILVLNLI